LLGSVINGKFRLVKSCLRKATKPLQATVGRQTTMKKILKWTLIILGIGLLTYVGYWVYVFAVFSGVFDKSYSTRDLIDNYNKKTTQIWEVKSYVNKIVPPNKSVDIEFDGNHKFFIFHVVDNGNYDSNWNLKLSSPKTDTLLQELGWTKEKLKLLKEKLDNANCISVASGEPCEIGFQRSGMGKYFYILFDKPIADSMKNKYNDSCTYILYNDSVVLEYGGGAIGPQCFPTFKRGK